MSDYSSLPDDLPAPADDGAADHLPGTPVPRLALPATSGGEIDLAELAQGLLVAYVYPRTGTPGEALPDGWDDIPGARGCTPQSCAYRDSVAGFERHGARLVGISAQSEAEQAEFAAREHIPIRCSPIRGWASPPRSTSPPSRSRSTAPTRPSTNGSPSSPKAA